jgi:hypothetical protein
MMSRPILFRGLFPLAILATLLPCSCGVMNRETKVEMEESPFGASGIPPQLRPRGAPAPAAGVTATVAAPGTTPEPMQFTPEEDIVFTDPDNPDANLPELSTMLKQEKKRGPWEESDTIARKRAAREGKPLLIWFTDSSKSPMCKALSEELFSKPEFSAWANEHVIRLKVDAYVAASSYVSDPNIGLDEKDTRRIDATNYVERLKKQYKALGYPAIRMLNPSGEVVGRYNGFKRGQADFLWGQMKHAVEVSKTAHRSWQAGLGKKGYREWRDRSGRAVFAKLTGYKDGTLILIEPDGTRCKTHESKLSKEDQDWIDQQKKLRGM